MSFEILLVISILAGFVGAMSGMGGGVVLISVLTLLGVDLKHAIGISIISVAATSSGAAAAYVRDHITNLKVGMLLEMFTIVGALVGAAITISAQEGPLYILFGIVLLTSWAVLFFHRGDKWHPPANQDPFSRWLQLEGSYNDQAAHEQIRYRATRAYLGGPLMFGAGLIAGLLGIGAGALKVVIHDLVMSLPPKVSTTTSNLIIGVTALSGASVYLAAGLIDPALAAPVIIGIVFGAFIGMRILVRLTNQSVRFFFSRGPGNPGSGDDPAGFGGDHVIHLEGTRQHQPATRVTSKSGKFDMEVLVGYILLGGVLLSLLLIVLGVIWHWLTTGELGLNYTITGTNLSQFVIHEFELALQAAFVPACS